MTFLPLFAYLASATAVKAAMADNQPLVVVGNSGGVADVLSLWKRQAEALDAADMLARGFVERDAAANRHLDPLLGVAEKPPSRAVLDDETLRPTPEYWATLLWRRLMGGTAFAVALPPTAPRSRRCVCPCFA